VCVRVLVTSTCTRWAPAGGRRGALRRPPSAHLTVTPTGPSSTASLRLVISRQHLCQPSARDDAQALRGALRARRERVPAEDAAVRAPGARPGAHGAPGAARRLRCGPARHGPDRRLEARPAVDRRHLGEGEDPARGPLRLLRGRGRQRSAPRARGAARARRAGAPRERRAAAARAARDERRAGRRASGDARAPSTPAPPQASTRPTTRGRRSRARPRPKRARTSTSASSSSSSSAPSSSPWPSTSGTSATRPTASSTSRRRRRRRRRPRRSSGSARRRTPRSAAERSAGCANLATISTLGRAAVRGAGEGGVRVPRARARAASTERPPHWRPDGATAPGPGGALPGRNASRRTLADAVQLRC